MKRGTRSPTRPAASPGRFARSLRPELLRSGHLTFLQTGAVAAMSVAATERYFEDYTVGTTDQFGAYEITEREIIDFARRYDPQPFHIDPQAARESSFGGLVASGWMTGAVMMRMMVDHYISRAASMGSPGLDQIRWVRPVRAGDVLHVRITVTAAKRSQSKPDRGVIWFDNEVADQHGEVVMTCKGMGMYRCRGAVGGQ